MFSFTTMRPEAIIFRSECSNFPLSRLELVLLAQICTLLENGKSAKRIPDLQLPVKRLAMLHILGQYRLASSKQR